VSLRINLVYLYPTLFNDRLGKSQLNHKIIFRRCLGKILRQICTNQIGTSWRLVTQHATSVTVSIIKIKVDKLHPCFGSRGSEVQIPSPRPFKTMGYGLGRSPFFIMASAGASVWYCMVWFSYHDYNLSLFLILKTEDRVLRFLATK